MALADGIVNHCYIYVYVCGTKREELQEEGNELQEYTLDELREMQEDNVKPKLDRNIVELEGEWRYGLSHYPLMFVSCDY